MQVLLDENGYISSFSLSGGIFENGIEVECPIDEELFKDNYTSWKYEDGRLIFDEDKGQADQLEKRKEELRVKRDQICFPVINRGQLWYDILTNEQKKELATWYQAWLDATETLKEPEMPDWLKEMM